MQTKSKQQILKVEEGSIVTPLGFSTAGLHTKVKRKRNDLGVVYCDVPADSAAVYTLNQIIAAPLKVTKQSLAEEGKLQAVVINSGNANACTGDQGLIDAYLMRDAVADLFSIKNNYVGVASTGVIGEKMPMDKILPGIGKLVPQKSSQAANQFNEAILTTDTCMKTTCFETTIDSKKITMAGSAKGSGMIAPNMATMLGFITTDAHIPHEYLQVALKEVTNETFNRITVDGDTSTNDMVIVMASGLASNNALSPAHEDWEAFIQLLKQVCQDLAMMIARDGEGATKLIEVNVQGAATDEEAGKVAKTVVGSDLVKTMVFGSDPNWGRVMMAIGRSGMTLDPETIDITIGPHPLLVGSQPTNYVEENLSSYLNNEKVEINIHLNIGDGSGKAWGCDLTYDYVRINASYRT
ncbi:bifunctional glutamate N-acetyltransferase/amino-acid acetyltransferase ArgJ [Lederbergia citrea]|uniref:bifunctional glutamate N-acetyltransferase/amino-acid acetyltransferase ArgJ n=1 Tax=Lederbergia citrea TaxID=2833581 RepID=UPI001BC90221|nr:bifunctional glutamate N-acetyltransferase/amino-acid acetyltransferase ArgJ [Lederbergia citrea]MBS4203476.1 bifunctional glutamate N-acetyltransferase/amino-acid acetyltransferase ArgJ [Lederbergia citrea]